MGAWTMHLAFLPLASWLTLLPLLGLQFHAVGVLTRMRHSCFSLYGFSALLSANAVFYAIIKLLDAADPWVPGGPAALVMVCLALYVWTDRRRPWPLGHSRVTVSA